MFDGSLFNLSDFGPDESEATDQNPDSSEIVDSIEQDQQTFSASIPEVRDESVPDRSNHPDIAPSRAIANSAPTALYRKYRPQSFDSDDLFGQDHVVHTLRNAIALDRIAHAYLFCGPRGTGKTTTARILAKAVNCDDPNPMKRPCNVCPSCVAINTGATTDVIEIDAASNRGIDDIRDLRERVKYSPTQLRTKFYIIDEAHQITGAAANAFLKTLEEPPAHTKFILATTDPEDLLQTIVSRCQRFDFRRIPLEAMIANLSKIADAENIQIDDKARSMIARHATGSLRDAQGLLDQVAVYRENADDSATRVTADLVRTILGVSRNDRVETIATALADRDPAIGVRAIGEAVADGEDVRQLARQLLTYMRELLLERSGGMSDLDGDGKALAKRFELGELAELTKLLGDIDFKVKHATIAQLPLEIAVVEGAMRGSLPPKSQHVRTEQPPAVSPAQEIPMKPAGSGSLINRVRSGERRQPTEATKPVNESRPPARPATSQAPDAQTTQPHTPAVSAPAADTSARSVDVGQPGELTIDSVRNRWGQIKADVSAVNVRVGALMSEMDPAAVEGNKVILTVPYPFHAGKMNSDDTRPVVEQILTRVMGSTMSLECFTTDDFRKRGTRVVAPAPQSQGDDRVAEAVHHAPDESQAMVDPTESLNALRNIFDAEEIDRDKN